MPRACANSRRRCRTSASCPIRSSRRASISAAGGTIRTRASAAQRICEISRQLRDDAPIGTPGRTRSAHTARSQRKDVMPAIVMTVLRSLLFFIVVRRAFGRDGRSCSCRSSSCRARATVWMGRSAGARSPCGDSRSLPALDFEMRGKSPAGGVLVAAKHMSMWDTLTLYLLLDDPAMILKRSLFCIPFFGWYAWKTGSIGIDREGGASALRRMARAARRVIAAGRAVVIFPEGSRRKPGRAARLQTRRRRAIWLLGVPCMPVALNSGPVLDTASGKAGHHRPRIPSAHPGRARARRIHAPARRAHRDGDRTGFSPKAAQCCIHRYVWNIKRTTC